MMNKNLLGTLLFYVWLVGSSVNSSCPNSEGIIPCKCQTIHGETTLKCANITHVKELEDVAENSDGYRYDKVYIRGSILPCIPFEVMERIRMTSLFLKDMSLTQLFQDIPHTRRELKNIYLQNINLARGFSWEVFKYAKGLEFIYVDHVSIPIISREFNEFVTHELKGVYFVYTNTKEIQIDAFKNFRKLDSITVAFNKLTKLYRNSFPQPFNGRALYFQHNNLTEVQESFLSQMPRLISVFFSGNRISRIYQPVDAASLSHIETIDFTGNPIKCDCYLKWVPILKPESLRGICMAPKKLKGKHVKDLTEDDFDC